MRDLHTHAAASVRMKLPRLALAVHQPWAWLLVHAAEYADPKNIENRGWSTRFRGPVLIHATKQWTREQLDDCAYVMEEFGVALPKEFERGGIVGKLDIIDCVSASPSRWFCGEYGFVCANARPLPFIPCRGDRMFYTPPAQALAAAHAALGGQPNP